MSTIYVCELDGGIIQPDRPYVSIDYVRTITPKGDGTSSVVDHSQRHSLTFHDGICAAGWLGKLRVGEPL